MTELKDIDDDNNSSWSSMPLRYQARLLFEFHWRRPLLCLGSLVQQKDPYHILLERQRVRYLQLGHTCDDERWWNEMPVNEFMAVICCGDGDEDEAGQVSDHQT